MQVRLFNLDLLTLSLIRHHREHRNDRRRDGFANSCLGYVTKGGGTFTDGPATLRLSAGELIYIPKGQRYISQWSGDPAIEFYSLNFELRGTALAGDTFAFQVIPDRKGELKRHFDRMNRQFETHDLLSAVGEFYQLYASVSKRLTPVTARRLPERLLPAVRYLDEHAREDFSNRQLAELCGLGESQFYAAFRSATGTTPVAYKNRVRAQAALALLSDDKKSVETISEELNFSSPSYLRRVLRAHTGLRPKDWRKRSRGLEP